jgi:hypothetical protein
VRPCTVRSSWTWTPDAWSRHAYRSPWSRTRRKPLARSTGADAWAATGS